MSQYIVHAAPYSSPNSRKNLRSKWNVQNLKVSQENPNAGGGVFASFDLVNTSNPKDKKYTMKFSFADGTSMTANAINRIRRFFNEAYDRQRSSSYGFPELSDTEKTQIVARINTAYNQWAGFSHSVDEPDVIDCTSNQDNEPDYLSVKMSDIDNNYLEHAANPYPYRPDVKLDGNQLVITFTDVTNNRTATLSVNLVGAKNYKDVEDRLDNLLQAAYDDGKDWGNISKNAFDSIMRQVRALNIFNDKTASNHYVRRKSQK